MQTLVRQWQRLDNVLQFALCLCTVYLLAALFALYQYSREETRLARERRRVAQAQRARETGTPFRPLR